MVYTINLTRAEETAIPLALQFNVPVKFLVGESEELRNQYEEYIKSNTLVLSLKEAKRLMRRLKKHMRPL
jgi:hypothetical protein